MNSKLFKQNELYDDVSMIWQAGGDIPEGIQELLIPLAVWQEQPDQVLALTLRKLLLLAPDSEINQESISLKPFSGIAIEFPGFLDGRGYSLARIVREQWHYKEEIRAVGDVLVDQLFYMQRCGFNSFALKEGSNPDDVRKALTTFSVQYQSDSGSSGILQSPDNR